MLVLIRGILLIVFFIIIVKFFAIKKEDDLAGEKNYIATIAQPIILMDNSVVSVQINFDYFVINKKYYKSHPNPIRVVELTGIVFLRKYADENINDKNDLETKKEEINGIIKNLLIETGTKFGMELTNVYVIFEDKNELI